MPSRHQAEGLLRDLMSGASPALGDLIIRGEEGFLYKNESDLEAASADDAGTLGGDPPAFYLDRANHTGLEPLSAITPSPTDDRFLATRAGVVIWDEILASDVPALDATKIATGQFADGRISASSVTQHQGLFSLDASQITSGVLDIGRIPADLRGHGIVQRQALAPTGDVDGELWQDSDDDILYVWDGTAWQAATSTAAAHALVGPDHTASGLTIGHVVRATGATTFTWGALNFSDLSGSIGDGQVPQSAVTQHQAALSIGHGQLTFSGLTAGHVWRASGAAAASFAALQVGDLPSHTHPAGDVTSGTFGTGGFTFPSAVTMQSTFQLDGEMTLGVAGVSNAIFNTPESMFWNIDSNSMSSANEYFEWGKDRTGPSGGTALMRLVEQGHLALGTTDVEAWGSGFVAFHLGDQGSLYGRTDGVQQVSLQQGVFVNSSSQFIARHDTFGYARYVQSRGVHVFQVAPAVAEGSQVSFDDVLTIQESVIDVGVQLRPVTGGTNLGGSLAANRWRIFGTDLDLSGVVKTPLVVEGAITSKGTQGSLNLLDTTTVIGDGDVIGQINWQGVDDSQGIAGIISGRAAGTWSGSTGSRPLQLEFFTNDGTSGAFRMILEKDGQLALKSSSDPSTRTGYAHFYAKDSGGRSEAFVRDDGGFVTQLSAHDPLTREWYHRDYDWQTGIERTVWMERFVQDVIEALGMPKEVYYQERLRFAA